MPGRPTFEIVRLYVSSSRLANVRERRPFTAAPMLEQAIVRVQPGRGIVSIRHSERAAEPTGHVTMFSEEVWLRLLDDLEVPGARADPAVLRRNILVRGPDLLELVGRNFSLQDVRFKGARYCEPGSWMDEALWPGTARLLKERRAGGLRAIPLTGGILVCDAEPRNPWSRRP